MIKTILQAIKEFFFPLRYVTVTKTPVKEDKRTRHTTHTAYPEIQILEHTPGDYRWKLRLYSYKGCGEVVEQESGSKSNYAAAKREATDKSILLIEKYEV